MAIDKFHSRSSNDEEKPSEKSGSLSARDAMMDYYDDVLGSLADDPLKTLEEAEKRQRQIDSVQLVSDKQVSKLGGEGKKASTPLLKVKPKIKSKPSMAQFAEPEATKVAPLIIPAAFPKLAPPVVKTDTEKPVEVVEKESVKQQTITGEKELVKPKQKVCDKAKLTQKIDRKTALKILEKNRSKLSTEQIARLEQKLAKKELVSTNTSVRVEEAKKVAEPELSPSRVAGDANEIKNDIAVSSGVNSGAGLNSQKGKLPEWAAERFECLIFTVAGLKLAVPLVSLGAVYKIEKEFTPLPGRADYFIGLYRQLDRNVQVVDTAKWVMPDRWRNDVRDQYRFIIRLGGNNWGLACDAVHESIQLTSDQVKWRSERTKRSWLLGTVIDHMCALLDADMMSLLLQDKKHPS